MKSYKEDDHPFFQFYPDDWLSDQGLALCSLAAQGLWIRMLAIIWQAETRGCLTVNGRQVSAQNLAKLSNAQATEVSKLLAELKQNNVYSVLSNGAIINRRVFRLSADSDGNLVVAAKKDISAEHHTWQVDSDGNLIVVAAKCPLVTAQEAR